MARRRNTHGSRTEKTGAGAASPEVSITPTTFMSEGEPVEAILYRRHDLRGRLPALVVSTGMNRALKGMEFLARPLAQRGYLVLTQRYRDLVPRFHPRDEVDIGNAISYVEGLPDVDVRRVGIAGHSRGGAAVLRATAKDPRPRSVVAMAGPTDYDHWARGIQHYSPAAYAASIKRYGVAPDEDPEYFRIISPLTYVKQIKVPVLIMNGASDFVTPRDHAQWMYDALIEAGHPHVRLEILPGLGHYFETYEGFGFAKVAEMVGQWFDETL